MERLNRTQECLVKLMELAKMIKLTSLIRKKDIDAGWKLFIDFLHQKEKNKLMIYGFDAYNKYRL